MFKITVTYTHLMQQPNLILYYIRMQLPLKSAGPHNLGYQTTDFCKQEYIWPCANADYRGIGMLFLIIVIVFSTTCCQPIFKMLLFTYLKCLDFLTSNTSPRTKFCFWQLNSRQFSQQPEQATQEKFPSWTNTSALKVLFVYVGTSQNLS